MDNKNKDEASDKVLVKKDLLINMKETIDNLAILNEAKTAVIKATSQALESMNEENKKLKAIQTITTIMLIISIIVCIYKLKS